MWVSCCTTMAFDLPGLFAPSRISAEALTWASGRANDDRPLANWLVRAADTGEPPAPAATKLNL